MNLYQKIAKESTITFSGMVYGNLNRYLYTALLARWVGVEYLGIYSLANAIMLIGEVIAKMGLETGVMRFVSRLELKTEKYQTTENNVFSIIEGSGRTIVGEGDDEQIIEWQERDIIVVPCWYPHRLEADEDAVIFSFSDKVVQTKLGLWRERRGNA